MIPTPRISDLHSSHVRRISWFILLSLIDKWRALKMRKVMAVVFALVIMTCSSFSMAEGIDISTLSDDELVALMARVQ